MKLKLKDGNKFQVGDIKGVAISSKKDIESASIAFLDVKGKHGKMKSTGDDRFYFVLEGKGKFILNDKEIDVEKDDLIIVPKNTIYDFQGKMKLILFITPAFNPKNEVYFDN